MDAAFVEERITQGCAARNGTCVVIVPSCDGLIVGADRLVTSDDGIPIDDEDKLHLVGSRGLFIVTGRTAFGATAAGDDLFDAVRVTKEYFAGRILETLDWKEYRSVLGNALHNALSHVPFSAWPPTAVAPKSLLQVLTLFLDERVGIRLVVVSVSYQRQQPLNLDLKYENASQETFELARPIVCASREVWEEIRCGSDPRFNDLRTDRLFELMARGTTLASALSSQEAVVFVRKLILETGRRKQLLGGSVDVGSTSDIVILRHDEGAIVRVHRAE